MPKPKTPARRNKAAERRAAVALAAVNRGALNIERKFTREIGGIMRGLHDAFMRGLEPAMRARVATEDSTRNDAGERFAKDIAKLTDKLIPQLAPKVGKAHDAMSAALDANYRAGMKSVLPIGWERIPAPIKDIARDAREKSIGYVEEAGRAYAQQVREVFEQPEWTHGRVWEDLRDALLERGGVSESRAELIARDQTLKLNGAMNQARQESVGVETYTWSTSGDERVRATHEELDGEICAWSDPPLENDDGEKLHPGEDFQCRCIAIPVIPEIAEWEAPPEE